ncbi:hypothetical protein D3C85_1052010 [compost metagenome]
MLLGIALQHRPDPFQALALPARQRVVHLVEAAVDPLEGGILVIRRPVTGDETVDAGPQHGRVTPHEPGHVTLAIQHQVPIQAQLGHHLGPALGNRLLHRRQRVDAGLDHLQHIFHRQGRIGPLDNDGRQLARGQLLVDLAQCLASRAAYRQGDAAAGELLQALIAPLTLAADQEQRYVLAQGGAGADISARPLADQLAGRHQVAFAALQRDQQLVLGPGDYLQPDFTPVAGIAVEVLLEGADPVVLHPDRLALDLPGAVAALVHQHLEHAAAADLRQVAGFRRPLPGFRRSRQARAGRVRQQRQQAEQEQQRSRHRFSRNWPGLSAGRKLLRRETLPGERGARSVSQLRT